MTTCMYSDNQNKLDVYTVRAAVIDIIYISTGIRDTHLELQVALGGYHGSMHFIRFPTSAMPAFIDLAMSKNFPLLATTICATGGGAHKFSEQYKTVSVLRLGVVPRI